MAKLPSALSLGDRPVPSRQRGIYGYHAGMVEEAEAAAWQAVGRMGEDLAKEGFARLDRERRIADEGEYTRARAEFLRAKIAADGAFDSDPDWRTYEPRYRAALDKARERALAMVSNPELRVRLESDTLVDMERGIGLVRGKAKARETDAARAGLQNLIATNQDTALRASDPQDRAALLDASHAAIDAAAAAGYLTAEEALTQRRKAAESYAEGVIGLLPPEERVKVLSQGMSSSEDSLPIFAKTGKMVDFIAPDRRMAMLRTAERTAEAVEAERVRRLERAERLADKKHREMQEAAAADLRLKMLGDEQVTERDLVAALQTRAISRDQFDQLYRQLQAEETPEDNVTLATAIRLDIGQDDPRTLRSRIADAQAAGLLTRETTFALLNEVDEHERNGGVLGSEPVRSAFAFIRDNVGGVRGPLAVLDTEASSREAAAIREARERIIKGEDPFAVADDVIRRYRPVDPGTSALPRPRYLVGSKQAPDLDTTERNTVAAFQRGEIDRDTFEREAELLRQYRSRLERPKPARSE